MINKEWREYFKGVCPYTDKPCKLWLCRLCRIEWRERRYLQKETDNEQDDL